MVAIKSSENTPKNQPENQPVAPQLQSMLQAVAEFCADRDWDQFHDAKELAIGLVTESSELLEHFRFRSKAEIEEFFGDPAKREQIEDEMADILFFLLRFAGRYEVNLPAALASKMKKNDLKYPVEKSRGSNRKYSEFQDSGEK